jgi:hypothetical protein
MRSDNDIASYNDAKIVPDIFLAKKNRENIKWSRSLPNDSVPTNETVKLKLGGPPALPNPPGPPDPVVPIVRGSGNS